MAQTVWGVGSMGLQYEGWSVHLALRGGEVHFYRPV